MHASTKHESAQSQAGVGWDSHRDRRDLSQSYGLCESCQKVSLFRLIAPNFFRISTYDMHQSVRFLRILSPFRINTFVSVHSKTT